MIPNLEIKYDSGCLREYERDDFGDEIGWAEMLQEDITVNPLITSPKILPKSSSMVALRSDVGYLNFPKPSSCLRNILKNRSELSDAEIECENNLDDDDMYDPFTEFETVVRK